METKNKKQALLILDVQKGFINEYTKVIPALVQELQYNYDHVFILKFFNPGNKFRFVKWMSFNKFMKDSVETELAFEPKENSKIIEKFTYSCVNTKFLKNLYDIGINEVHICGINTDICVMANALALFDNDDFKPIVLSKYCASTRGESQHNYALECLSHALGEQHIQ